MVLTGSLASISQERLGDSAEHVRRGARRIADDDGHSLVAALADRGDQRDLAEEDGAEPLGRGDARRPSRRSRAFWPEASTK